jgi:hypothetical protein
MDKRPLLSCQAVSYSSFGGSSVDGDSIMSTPSESSNSYGAHDSEKGQNVTSETNFFKRSVRDGTFEDSQNLETFFEPIKEYEGRHRYDPQFEWDPKEEKTLVRKIDWKICSWVCLMFFALQLDRGNISQALSDNMLDDLGLSTNEYNTGQYEGSYID